MNNILYQHTISKEQDIFEIAETDSGIEFRLSLPTKEGKDSFSPIYTISFNSHAKCREFIDFINLQHTACFIDNLSLINELNGSILVRLGNARQSVVKFYISMDDDVKKGIIDAITKNLDIKT